MRFPLTDQLVAEAERYGLRSACGDCLFFVTADGSCVHGWPNRDQALTVADAAKAGVSVSFCKEFELA